MRSRWILNLILAALVAGLAALVYFKPGTEKAARPPLTNLSPAAMTRLRIERPGQQPIALDKTPGGWRLTAPIRARANSFNVDRLLRALGAPSSFQAVADSSTLAKFGLDKPGLRLQFNDEQIAVGAMHPMRQQHYVRYRDTVHLIPSDALSAAFLGYTPLIDTQLLENERQLVALTLPTLRLVRTDGAWQVESQVKNKHRDVSADRLNEFVAHWQNARALSVEQLSAKSALARIALVSEANGKRDTLTLEVLAYRPDFVLARRDEGMEYHFPEDVGKRLLTLETTGDR